MVRNPSVSVVITCYNYGRYLAGCIQSVLEQTLQDYEIIVVNDGSTDETDLVAQQFSGYEKLHYIRQENAGQANAKNTGIKNSRGEYVAFLDADDLWEKDKLEKQMPLFSSDSVGVVFTLASYIDEKGAPVAVEPPGGYLSPRRGKVSDFLFLDNFVPFSSSIVRMECLHEFGGFDESLKMGIDWDLWLRISTRYEFDYVDEPLLLYRLGHSGQMSKNAEERQRCSDRIMKRFLDAHGDEISGETVKKAAYYTCCNRIEYYASKEKSKAMKYVVDAVRIDPVSGRAYLGIAKAICRSFMAVGRVPRS
jgi:glycosyltransferase involved in cell wall biosynthesis